MEDGDQIDAFLEQVRLCLSLIFFFQTNASSLPSLVDHYSFHDYFFTISIMLCLIPTCLYYLQINGRQYLCFAN